MNGPRRQAGLSLLAAVFLLTGLAVFGAVLTRLAAQGQDALLDEWDAARALYAAESGVQWAARDLLTGGSGSVSDAPLDGGDAWFSTSVAQVTVGGRSLYTITATGSAGGSAAAPRAQRRVVVEFMP